ncbi:MAG: tRNA (N(6)-L-threonylcarbamoyladenosine(37)-C(2))-methylthiotransferase MtaB [Proteobacteria bacterium]|nr:tRNA (N(6)-L-threonylcarbamoyladenosine(37)-C(2))-methylthiotransferase MtaB [Pseudomonadota bacterium]
MTDKMTDNTKADNARLKVALTTLGCKANQYDTSAIEDSLTRAGIALVDFSGHADAYIINTCTVTNRTDSQSRTLIRRVRRENKEAVVIVTGCYATVSPDEIKEMDGVDYVVSNTGKDRLVEYIKRGRKTDNDKAITDSPAPRATTGTPISLRTVTASKRTRATLKIQDGCSKACSYCIIPKARGVSRSIDFDTLESEIKNFIDAGYKEIVLTGIHLGDYAGRENSKENSDNSSDNATADITAVARLLSTKSFDCRFRFSSLDPDEVTDEFIEILRTSTNICNHVHLPLQSGNDEVLGRMNRQYTVARFIERVERLAEIPGISIGTDIITGFPGETVEAFEETYATLKALPISYLHIFPYSPRAGTPAASYAGAVHGLEIKRRAALLKRLDTEKRKRFMEAHIGQTLEVLVERVDKKNAEVCGTGKTRNYIPVTITGDSIEANTLVSVTLSSVSKDGREMTGTLKTQKIKTKSLRTVARQERVTLGEAGA